MAIGGTSATPSPAAATGADGSFEPVTAVAARLLGVSSARVRLSVDEDCRDEIERLLLERALAGDRVLVVPDLAAEPGFRGRTSAIRFFAAAPLVSREGRRLGTLSVSDPLPRPPLCEADARDFTRLARIVVDQIELRGAQDRLTAELASRRLAEARLKLANDITDAALAAPDFRAAIAACLRQAAEHVGADCAIARGLSPRTGKLETEAHYLAPSAADLAAAHDRMRATAIAPEKSVLAEAIIEQRPLILPDLRTVDARRYPLLAAVRDQGIRSLVSIPFANRGSRFSFSFLFRRPPADLRTIAETLASLAGRVRDLLARKQAEEQITLLQSVVLYTGDAVVISEAGPEPGELPHIVYVNPAFSRITGFAAEAVHDRPPTILSGPRTEAGALARLAFALRRPRRAHVGMHLHRSDGSPFWAEIDVTPVAEGGGSIRHWIAVIRDRTEHRATGEAQRQSELALRRLTEQQTAVLDALRREKEFSDFLIRSITEGILVFDRQFRVTLWNPGLEAITAIAAEEANGRNVFEVLPFMASGPGEQALRGALEGKESAFFDQRYAIGSTGRHGFVEAYFSPLRSTAEDIVGGIGFLRETTERRRIEDELRQSQKMEAVGQLTGGIAHDFNNMLTVIAGNLELLEGKIAAEPRLMRLVNAATMAASRAEKLTQQLLTFSRRQQLRPQPVDFNQIIIGMDELLHRTVGETIEIRTALAPDLWPALADPNQLETALLNLVLNARDAMPRGGRLTLETANVEADRVHPELAPGAYTMLSIADTGIGMSEHVLGHVFEPFFTTKEVGKGTGLGLAQVYGFINQSSGLVRLDSKEGEGTVVRLYLPRAEAAAGVGAFTPARSEAYRGSETVLVAEDDHGVRDFAASVLRELGYRVLEASNGEIALALLDEHPEIQLLFTDLVMPGNLNGADLASAALDRRPALAVLFTSGYSTRLLEKDWPDGSVEFLRKPYRSVEIAEHVRHLLDRTVEAAE